LLHLARASRADQRRHDRRPARRATGWRCRAARDAIAVEAVRCGSGVELAVLVYSDAECRGALRHGTIRFLPVWRLWGRARRYWRAVQVYRWWRYTRCVLCAIRIDIVVVQLDPERLEDRLELAEHVFHRRPQSIEILVAALHDHVEQCIEAGWLELEPSRLGHEAREGHIRRLVKE